MSTAIASLLFLSTSSAVLLKHLWSRKKLKCFDDEPADASSSERVVYSGGCHCRAVTFALRAPEHLVVWECDCSICKMKKNFHFIIPERDFKLLSGANVLQEYRFNTKTAIHLFCSVCGVQSYYSPRSNPDGYAITFECLDNNDV